MFRRLLKPLHSAENPEDFARVGYRAVLLVFVAVALAARTATRGSALWLEVSGWAAEKVDVPIGWVHWIPPELLLSVLLWWLVGKSKSYSLAIGTASATVLLQILDLLAGVGEWLGNKRWAAVFLSVLLLTAGGWSLSRARALARDAQFNRDQRIAWLMRLEQTLLASTHSVRDMPRVQEIGDLPGTSPQRKLADLPTPIACLANLTSGFFDPFGEPDPGQQLMGTQWLDRIRLTLRSDMVGSCSQLRISEYPAASHARRALSLFYILLGRSHMRVAGESCEDSRSVSDAIRVFKLADVKLHRSAVNSGLGNAYSCAARLHAFSAIVPTSMELACEDVRACQSLATSHHRKSAQGYDDCDFESLRAVNNLADQSLKLVVPKWTGSMESSRLFQDKKAIIESLLTWSDQLVHCLGQENTPAEVSVTIAQIYGAVALARPSEIRWLQQSGWYLAASLVAAPTEWEHWDYQAFCAALVPDLAFLNSEFYASLEHAGVHPNLRSGVLRRIVLSCQ